MVSIRRQINQVPIFPLCFSKISFAIRLCMARPSSCPLSVILQKLCIHFCSVPCEGPATWLVFLILFDSIILMLFVEDYKSVFSLLCCFLQPPAVPPSYKIQMFSSSPCSGTSSLYAPTLIRENPVFFTDNKNSQNCSFVCLNRYIFKQLTWGHKIIKWL